MILEVEGVATPPLNISIQSERNRNIDFIKFLALAFMIVDHLGATIFKEVYILRIIGRISMPLFAYCVVYGMEHTKNIKKYTLRMLYFSIISQIPYSLLFNNESLNIGFTYLIGMGIILCLEKKELPILRIVIALFSIIIAKILKVDYGIYGILELIGFYYMYTKKCTGVYIIIANTVYYGIVYDYANMIVQAFSLISLLFISLLEQYPIKRKFTLPKYTFYIFYPAHMLIFKIATMIIK